MACLEPTESRVVPCDHAICEVCARRWMATGRRVCPTCRQPFVTLSSFVPESPERGESIVAMYFDDEKNPHLGITLATGVPASRVVVKHVERNDMAYRHGIRAHDVITRINSLSVGDHETAIAVIETARRASVPLTFHVQRRPSRFSGMFEYWRKCRASMPFRAR